jgi:hypothetical protein
VDLARRRWLLTEGLTGHEGSSMLGFCPLGLQTLVAVVFPSKHTPNPAILLTPCPYWVDAFPFSSVQTDFWVLPLIASPINGQQITNKIFVIIFNSFKLLRNK